MKRFIIKLAYVLLLFLAFVLVKNRLLVERVCSAFYYDTFNVFHWKDIRFTEAEPNKNFIKTRYVLENPGKYNAFLFGSSRVGYIPPDRLPQELGGSRLSWYNMTCSEGIPAEHYLTLQSFLNNGVRIAMVIVEFDNIPMYVSLTQHKHQLLRRPYQVYEENKWTFFRPYLKFETPDTIKEELDGYVAEDHRAEHAIFYDYGTNSLITDFGLTENPQMKYFEAGHPGYPFKDSYKDLKDIVLLCREHDIELVLFTTPLFQTIYRNTVADGYFDFLRSVAQECAFYNFSTLNNFTKDPSYYFDCNHYRPILGLFIEKILFGTDEEREKVILESGDDLFGMRIDAENVDYVLDRLRRQLDE